MLDLRDRGVPIIPLPDDGFVYGISHETNLRILSNGKETEFMDGRQSETPNVTRRLTPPPARSNESYSRGRRSWRSFGLDSEQESLNV